MDSGDLPAQQIQKLLERVGRGEAGAPDALVEALGPELHGLAGRLLRGDLAGHTLQPTALVNEAWLRLFKRPDADFGDRGHFMNAAARAMRSILIDHARRKQAAKRGGNMQRHPLDAVAEAVEAPDIDLLALSEALEEFERLDPESTRIVELHFFAGRTFAEIAELLGLAQRTVLRRWKAAQAWLLSQLGDTTLGP